MFHKNVKVCLFLTLESFKRFAGGTHSQKQQVLVCLHTLCLLILLAFKNNNICPISSFLVHLDWVTKVSEHQIWVVCFYWRLFSKPKYYKVNPSSQNASKQLDNSRLQSWNYTRLLPQTLWFITDLWTSIPKRFYCRLAWARFPFNECSYHWRCVSLKIIIRVCSKFSMNLLLVKKYFFIAC